MSRAPAAGAGWPLHLPYSAERSVLKTLGEGRRGKPPLAPPPPTSCPTGTWVWAFRRAGPNGRLDDGPAGSLRLT